MTKQICCGLCGWHAYRKIMTCQYEMCEEVTYQPRTVSPLFVYPSTEFPN